METTAPPTDALTRLREYLADGFGFDPSAPSRFDGDAQTVTALALASIAEDLHALVTK